jgi:hypothetical protein
MSTNKRSNAAVQCPYVYANGEQCKGTVERVERYHVKAEWSYDTEADAWTLGVWDSGTHFHLFCTAVSEHNPPVKLFGGSLPGALQAAVYPGDA